MLYNLTTSPIFGLRREIDRLFEDTFTRGGNSWTPAVDIKETDNDLRLDLELPGLRPEDVEITAENGILTIRGEKRSERKEGEENRYHLVERSYGSFMRSFTLPQGVDENQIQASFDNGILSIQIPKAALPQPKKIQISGGQHKQQASVGSGNMSSQNQQLNHQQSSNQHSNAQQSTRNSTKSTSSSQRERSNEQVAAQSR
jgi:HSP20 family protein